MFRRGICLQINVNLSGMNSKLVQAKEVNFKNVLEEEICLQINVNQLGMTLN